MRYGVEIAKQLKARDNPEYEGPIIGEVVSINPLQISTNNGKVILNEDSCYICSNILSKSVNITLDSVADHGAITTTSTINNILIVGDLLLCLQSNGGKYFIIDKVVE